MQWRQGMDIAFQQGLFHLAQCCNSRRWCDGGGGDHQVYLKSFIHHSLILLFVDYYLFFPFYFSYVFFVAILIILLLCIHFPIVVHCTLDSTISPPLPHCRSLYAGLHNLPSTSPLSFIVRRSSISTELGVQNGSPSPARVFQTNFILLHYDQLRIAPFD